MQHETTSPLQQGPSASEQKILTMPHRPKRSSSIAVDEVVLPRMGASSVARRNSRTKLLVSVLLLQLSTPVAIIKVECDGKDEQWGICPDLPTCVACIPRNCEFGAWDDWYGNGGCSQLEFRERSIAQANNECGPPCNGSKIEARRKTIPGCNFEVKDCDLSDWGHWTPCGLGAVGQSQSYRVRIKKADPQNGGKACVGSLKETRACELLKEKVVDCAFGAWLQWTECSMTCGDGERTRLRRIATKAKYPGEPCYGPLAMTDKCILKSCTRQDCHLSDWNEWSECGLSTGHTSRFRAKIVLVHALGAGKPCSGETKEVGACQLLPPVDCNFTSWVAWGTCDTTCGGGQMQRARQVLTGPSHGGACAPTDLMETKACNTLPCYPNADCKFSEWETWATCSNQCGLGTTVRKRFIFAHALHGGHGCSDGLVETLQCNSTDGCGHPADCKWSLWDTWSSCTWTCGGGSKQRTRTVEVAPRCVGQLCGAPCEPLMKTEMESCNHLPCKADHCKNAEWSAWSNWSTCSSTCSSGFQSRTREVAQEADSCGDPLEGEREDYRSCDMPPCVHDQDCEVGSWSEWSSCSCSCYGSRERNRRVVKFAIGAGKPCRGVGLRESAGCSPRLGDEPGPMCGVFDQVDCKLSDWQPWGTCSRTCGGGQMEMSRKILRYSANAGKLCDGNLGTIADCNTKPCTPEKCMDCAWSQWQDWGDCSHCGGQRFRYRRMEVMPNHCGKPCDVRSSKEMGQCTSHCSETFACAWSPWSANTGCDGNACGSLAMRSRSLSFLKNTTNPGFFAGLFNASEDALCSGTQLYTSTCDTSICEHKCVPEDCSFSEWSEWEVSVVREGSERMVRVGNECLGLCFRIRQISKHNNDCGVPCVGDLEESKHCPSECHLPVDCVLGEWKQWGECKDSQKNRSRAIKKYPQNDGKPCDSYLQESMSCGHVLATPCVMNLWSEWGTCSKSCDGGLTTRVRAIMSQAEGGGILCDGSLKNVKTCNTQSCTATIDCKFDSWSQWSLCDSKRQKSRDRRVTQYSAGDGKSCSGGVSEIEDCGNKQVDCVFSAWTAWDDCDVTCGGGQHQRHREMKVHGESGGLSCVGVLKELHGCSPELCTLDHLGHDKQDCELGPWTAWETCSASCGGAQQMRSRPVAQERAGLGAACDGTLAETQPCATQTCPHSDCQLGDWEEWDACTCSCDGGQTSRQRRIQTMPSPGGKPCDAHKQEELAPCNTQPCNREFVVDGAWGNWSQWSSCSSTCESGVSYRSRKIVRMASELGNPAEGEYRQSRFCNEGVKCVADEDCQLSAWNSWSTCSMSCNGLKERARYIAHIGKGDGRYCVGGLRETWPCNPSVDEATPVECKLTPTLDCVMEDWQAWSECSATCDRGQQERQREIQTLPSNGGKPCESSLGEVRPCVGARCPGPVPIDCQFGDWEDWNACAKCGKQRKRFRSIAVQSAHGGKSCDAFTSEDTGSCHSSCEDEMFCAWSSWAQWGMCNARCGTGARKRVRQLQLQPHETKMIEPTSSARFREIMQKYVDLHAQASVVHPVRFSEIVSSFVAGFFGLAVVLGGFNFVSVQSARRRERERSERLYGESHRLTAGSTPRSWVFSDGREVEGMLRPGRQYFMV